MKPILFNGEMVRAILEGRKTQTRRIVKNQDGIHPRWNNIGFCGWDDGHGYQMKAPFEIGDILYVRETFCEPYVPGRYAYRADYGDHDVIENTDGNISLSANMFRWKPSIHMPKSAARIFLRVQDVRIEQLQSITPTDIDAEGGKEWGYSATTGELLQSGNTRFQIIWDSTIKKCDLQKYGWNANPWVWVISFERCEEPEMEW